MPFEVRPCRDRGEFVPALNGIAQYFGPVPSEEMIDRFLAVMPVERMHAAYDGATTVGGAGAFPFELSVPGGSLPCAGVTVVGVYPTHRRRGALRALMDAQLADVHERGEPIAALWASEETIYGRFGYGIAGWCGEIALPREWTAFAQPLERRGQPRIVDFDEALRLFPPVWETLRRERAGVFARWEDWWRLRPFRSGPHEAGAPRRFAVLETDGEVQAYAIYRQEQAFEAGVSKGTLHVVEAVGANAQATAEIWRFLLDFDWVSTVEAALLPPDHPLFLLLANPRRAKYRMGDQLWVRLIDVGAALSGRRYADEGELVLDVRDATCPWNEGRWLLAGGEASRTDRDADLALDVSALGSAYLGAVSFRELAAALRVEELREGATARADAMFGWRPLPWCPEIF